MMDNNTFSKFAVIQSLSILVILFVILNSLQTNGENSPKSEQEAERKSSLPLDASDGKLSGFDSSTTTYQAAVKMYRKLFKEKRSAHLEAVKMMMNLGSYEKQYKMVEMIFSKLFKVMMESKIRLMESGFTPGDPFPNADNTLDAFSITVENTAFLGEITLRLPDITHSLLKNNTEWQLLVQWGIGFCNDTKIFDGSESILLSMMAQELNIVERDPDFVNPYKHQTKISKLVNTELEKVLAEQAKAKKVKERKEKKKQRGPRMSSQRHGEL